MEGMKTGLRFRVKLRFRMSLWLKQCHYLGSLALFLVKIGLWFRLKLRFKINLRFRMSLCPQLHNICYYVCLGCLVCWLREE